MIEIHNLSFNTVIKLASVTTYVYSIGTYNQFGVAITIYKSYVARYGYFTCGIWY